MNNSLKFIAGGMVVLALAGGAVACSAQSGDVDVLQYGYYTPTHVYVTYPQPMVVHVSSKVYNSDHHMYSTPSYEKTYVKTHTVTHTTVNHVGAPTVSLNKGPSTTTHTVTHSVTTTRRK